MQQIIEDAKRFETLREDPAWKRLNDKVRADEEHFLRSLTSRLMAGEQVSQREIDWYRGFYAACKWLLGHPEQAMDNLEKAATRAWRMQEVGLLMAADEESPYIS